MHISTTDTFFIAAPVVQVQCVICLNVCNHEIGYIGMRCSVCNSVHDVFEMTKSDVVKKRRKLLQLERKDIADELGMKQSTIKRYETMRCSKIYFKRTERLMKLSYR